MQLFSDNETYDITRAAWCPREILTSLRDRIAEGGGRFKYGFSFSKPERKVLRKRKAGSAAGILNHSYQLVVSGGV